MWYVPAPERGVFYFEGMNDRKTVPFAYDRGGCKMHFKKLTAKELITAPNSISNLSFREIQNYFVKISRNTKFWQNNFEFSKIQGKFRETRN